MGAGLLGEPPVRSYSLCALRRGQPVAVPFWFSGQPYQHDLAQMWQDLQGQQARLSTRGKVLPVEAGHAVFREQPDAVIAAVLDMIAEIDRTKREKEEICL